MFDPHKEDTPAAPPERIMRVSPLDLRQQRPGLGEEASVGILKRRRRGLCAPESALEPQGESP